MPTWPTPWPGAGSGEINVLLCGDPGTSKSQMLQYVHKIAPRGIYTSGKGSTAVGLTAYITKDPDSKQFVLERCGAGQRRRPRYDPPHRGG